MTPFAQASQRAQLARCATLARQAVRAHGFEPLWLKNAGHGMRARPSRAMPWFDTFKPQIIAHSDLALRRLPGAQKELDGVPAQTEPIDAE